MPKVGDKEFSYDAAGMAAAKKESEMTGMPMKNAMERSMTEYAGGGKTGYGKIGMYKDGGKVNMYKDGGLTSSQKKRLKKHSEHHSAKHMNEMKKDIKSGSTFTKAHNKAMKKAGK